MSKADEAKQLAERMLEAANNVHDAVQERDFDSAGGAMVDFAPLVGELESVIEDAEEESA